MRAQSHEYTAANPDEPMSSECRRHACQGWHKRRPKAGQLFSVNKKNPVNKNKKGPIVIEVPRKRVNRNPDSFLTGNARSSTTHVRSVHMVQVGQRLTMATTMTTIPWRVFLGCWFLER